MTTDKPAIEDLQATAGSQPEFTLLRNELLEAVRKLCSKYDLGTRNGLKTVFVAKLLAGSACERRIEYLLRNHGRQETSQRFDPLYRLKSEYAVLKILDHLKTRLSSEGLRVSIETETEHKFGVSDIQIMLLTSDGKEQTGNMVRIEIKAGLGVSLEQLERYLWSGSPLIIARVMTRHVAVLEPSQLRRFVQSSMNEAIAKATRLANGNFQELPGTYCSDCPDFGCPYNCYRRQTATAMVKIREKEFESDLRLFFENIPVVAENVANVVVNLLTQSDHETPEAASR